MPPPAFVGGEGNEISPPSLATPSASLCRAPGTTGNAWRLSGRPGAEGNAPASIPGGGLTPPMGAIDKGLSPAPEMSPNSSVGTDS